MVKELFSLLLETNQHNNKGASVISSGDILIFAEVACCGVVCCEGDGDGTQGGR